MTELRSEGPDIMDMDQRRDRIVSLVNQEGCVSLTQLKRTFPDVSETTLRTDLKTLDAQRLIIRVHGGAKSVGFAIGTDDLLDNRAARHSTEKLEIARKAAQLVRPDTTIYMDSGSTATELADALPDMRLLIFTNSLTVATKLARLQQASTYLVGGRLNTYSLCTTGGSAIKRVGSLSFDQAFIGVTGYARGNGFTCGSDDEAVLKRSVCENATQTVVLMDSSKVGRQLTFPVCRLDEVDTVVSDDECPKEFVDDCEAASVRLL
ncbi:MAG: DeoR/GlpR family DNA-binding transcription regulator [Atopobiaceae bacterium]